MSDELDASDLEYYKFKLFLLQKHELFLRDLGFFKENDNIRKKLEAYFKLLLSTKMYGMKILLECKDFIEKVQKYVPDTRVKAEPTEKPMYFIDLDSDSSEEETDNVVIKCKPIEWRMPRKIPFDKKSRKLVQPLHSNNSIGVSNAYLQTQSNVPDVVPENNFINPPPIYHQQQQPQQQQFNIMHQQQPNIMHQQPIIMQPIQQPNIMHQQQPNIMQPIQQPIIMRQQQPSIMHQQQPNIMQPIQQPNIMRQQQSNIMHQQQPNIQPLQQPNIMQPIQQFNFVHPIQYIQPQIPTQQLACAKQMIQYQQHMQALIINAQQQQNQMRRNNLQSKTYPRASNSNDPRLIHSQFNRPPLSSPVADSSHNPIMNNNLATNSKVNGGNNVSNQRNMNQKNDLLNNQSKNQQEQNDKTHNRKMSLSEYKTRNENNEKVPKKEEKGVQQQKTQKGKLSRWSEKESSVNDTPMQEHAQNKESSSSLLPRNNVSIDEKIVTPQQKKICVIKNQQMKRNISGDNDSNETKQAPMNKILVIRAGEKRFVTKNDDQKEPAKKSKKRVRISDVVTVLSPANKLTRSESEETLIAEEHNSDPIDGENKQVAVTRNSDNNESFNNVIIKAEPSEEIECDSNDKQTTGASNLRIKVESIKGGVTFDSSNLNNVEVKQEIQEDEMSADESECASTRKSDSDEEDEELDDDNGAKALLKICEDPYFLSHLSRVRNLGKITDTKITNVQSWIDNQNGNSSPNYDQPESPSSSNQASPSQADEYNSDDETITILPYIPVIKTEPEF